MAFISTLPTHASTRSNQTQLTSNNPLTHSYKGAPRRRKSRATVFPKCQQQNLDQNLSSTAPDAQSEPIPTPKGPSLPKLYDAWFAPEHELSKQAVSAITAAYAAGIRKMELQWPTVPNLEEIAAGTLLNFEFGKQVAADLGMASTEDYPLIKRYLAQFCNLYWAKKVSQAPPFRERTVWVLSTDAVSKTRAEPTLGNVRLASLRNPPKKGEVGPDDVVVILDPRNTSVWVKGAKMLPEGGQGAVVFLNSQFNETYGLTGPRNGVLKGTEPVYFLKRVTRGYVYRSFPGDWIAYLEKPDLSVEVVGQFEGLPKLSEVAKVVREVSNNRYGGFYNDRYVRGFGGRL